MTDVSSVISSLGGSLLSCEAGFDAAFHEIEKNADRYEDEIRNISESIESKRIQKENAENAAKSELDMIEQQIDGVQREIKIQSNLIRKLYVARPDKSDDNGLSLYQKVLDLSDLVVSKDNSRKATYVQQINDFFRDYKSSTYFDIESMIRSFSVSSPSALKLIFFRNDSPGSSKAHEFMSLIDDVKNDADWKQQVAQCASIVFSERMRYHTENTEMKSDNSYSSLIVSLLRNTLQTASFILSPLEKIAPDDSIISLFCSCMFVSTLDLLSDFVEKTAIALRTLFLDCELFDEWVNEIEFFNFTSFSGEAFKRFGNEWMKLEFQAFQSAVDIELRNPNAFIDTSNTIPDVAVTITTILTKLYESSPSHFDHSQLKMFLKNCIVLCERYAVEQLENLMDCNAPGQACIIANSIDTIATQLNEMHDLSDAICADLLSDSETYKNRIKEIGVSLGNQTYYIFEQAASEYLTRGITKSTNGLVSYSLSRGMEAVSEYFNTVKAQLNEIIFELYYLPTIEHMIDNIIYKMVVFRSNFKKKGNIEQFANDVNALVSFFGGSDLRKIRSAKVILTQKEEKFLDCEISEDDIERLMVLAN